MKKRKEKINKMSYKKFLSLHIVVHERIIQKGISGYINPLLYSLVFVIIGQALLYFHFPICYMNTTCKLFYLYIKIYSILPVRQQVDIYEN